ncbi:MAG: chemotaxis protein CheR [Proteobacteria bacterium]|nr:MAG: chemotaxis protein CheR [Pseudomonadota bacterium]
MHSSSSDEKPGLKSERSPLHNHPYVIALGASAGGLTAIEAFFKNMPEGQNAAFVLIMHMAENHESPIAEILRGVTRMKIVAAENGLTLEKDTIYYVPSNREAKIINGSFDISTVRSVSPIDYFMTAVASVYAERAVGIILSGAGSDGAQGSKQIRAMGGLVMVQDPESADHASMPNSSIQASETEFVFAPREMPRHIIKWIMNDGSSVGSEGLKLRTESAIDLQRIIFLLKTTTGHDFTFYKKNTIKRRLERRMAAHNLDLLSDYVRFLETDLNERNRLLKELLIGVTNFFRDAEAFEALRHEVIPHILKDYVAGKPLRMWIAGCSTGEEAYSIAITVLEVCKELNIQVDLKIFASDIDKDAIEQAREGLFPVTINHDVSEERLTRYFVLRGNEFQIKKEVKDLIIFSHHDVARDPPFSKLDLISCRNLMIYMEPVLQQKLLRIFHYSLLPGGFLFMGNSETIGEAAGMFTTFDKRWKFYERKASYVSPSRGADFEAFRNFAQTQPELQRTTTSMPRKMAIRELSQDFLLTHFAPPSVVCDELGDILYIHGKTSNYLEPPMGEARLNIFAMAKDDIKLEVSRGFQKALTTEEGVRFSNIKIKAGNDIVNLDITVRILTRPQQISRMVMVTFEEGMIEPILDENTYHVDYQGRDEHVREIERELLFTREHMQTLVEQLETSNEELKSINEELQSSNEELQSSNEELETAKEELQAVNEELVTVNAELHEKIEELSTANNDLDNFLSSSSIATIFLDRHFLITRYSRSTTRIFNLIPSDIGRSLGDIVSQVRYEDVLLDAEQVLENLSTVERMVEMKDGRWLFMRINPYKTSDNVIDGVVIGFSDISEQRRLEKQSSILHKIVELGKIPVLVFDKNESILYISRMLQQMLGYSDLETASAQFENSRFKILDKSFDVKSQLPWQGRVSLELKSGTMKEFDANITAVAEDSDLRCVILKLI